MTRCWVNRIEERGTRKGASSLQRKTVIAVKNQNSPYVRLTVIMWGILGSGRGDVCVAPATAACQQPDDGKHQTKSFQICIKGIRILFLLYRVGFTVDNFLPLRREIGLKLV